MSFTINLVSISVPTDIQILLFLEFMGSTSNVCKKVYKNTIKIGENPVFGFRF